MASYYESLDTASFICRAWVTATCWMSSTRTAPPTVTLPWHQKSICSRTTCHPPLSATHHVSRLVPSLILQWLRIIVPPVAGFNYSHDATAQAVAAIASSITKNYCTANLQMHCLPVAYVWKPMCVWGIYDKHQRRKLLMLVFIIFRSVCD